MQFGGAQLGDGSVVFEQGRVDGAVFSACGGDEMDLDALGGVFSQRTAHAEGFIVRVGENGEEAFIVWTGHGVAPFHASAGFYTIK